MKGYICTAFFVTAALFLVTDVESASLSVYNNYNCVVHVDLYILAATQAT